MRTKNLRPLALLQNRRQLPRVTFYAPQNVAASSLCVSFNRIQVM